MRRFYVTDDDLDLDYMSTARSTDRLKNALIDSMDESFNKSRRADQKLMMDIDNRLNEPVYSETRVVHPQLQTVPSSHSGYIVVRAPTRAASVAPTAARTIRVPAQTSQAHLLSKPTLVPASSEVSYGPVVVPTRQNTSTRRVTTTVTETPVNISYRSDEVYPSGNGTALSFRKRILDAPSYESQARKYDDMRTRLALANQKIKEHRSITETHYDSQSARDPPVVTGLHYDYTSEKPRFSEPPMSDVRRRARAVLAKAKGRAY